MRRTQKCNTWTSFYLHWLPLSKAYCSAVEPHSKNCAGDVNTNQNPHFILYQVLNRTEILIRLKTKATHDINAYYHPISSMRKAQMPIPTENTVSLLTSRLNDDFLRLWCATQDTPFLKESIMAKLKYILQRSLKFLKIWQQRQLSNGKVSSKV